MVGRGGSTLVPDFLIDVYGNILSLYPHVMEFLAILKYKLFASDL
jgi:hypothetical protein